MEAESIPPDRNDLLIVGLEVAKHIAFLASGYSATEQAPAAALSFTMGTGLLMEGASRSYVPQFYAGLSAVSGAVCMLAGKVGYDLRWAEPESYALLAAAAAVSALSVLYGTIGRERP